MNTRRCPRSIVAAMRVAMCAALCVAATRAARIDMCRDTPLCSGAPTDLHVGMHVDMCTGMQADMRVDIPSTVAVHGLARGTGHGRHGARDSRLGAQGTGLMARGLGRRAQVLTREGTSTGSSVFLFSPHFCSDSNSTILRHSNRPFPHSLGLELGSQGLGSGRGAQGRG